MKLSLALLFIDATFSDSGVNAISNPFARHSPLSFLKSNKSKDNSFKGDCQALADEVPKYLKAYETKTREMFTAFTKKNRAAGNAARNLRKTLTKSFKLIENKCIKSSNAAKKGSLVDIKIGGGAGGNKDSEGTGMEGMDESSGSQGGKGGSQGGASSRGGSQGGSSGRGGSQGKGGDEGEEQGGEQGGEEEASQYENASDWE